jgi:hypothetical protein
MKKDFLGLLIGSVAGIIDVVPMYLQNLTWDANLSAFSMWVVVGFLNVKTELNLHPFFKGIILAYLVLLPTAILIGWQNPKSLIPILLITTFLGGLLGFTISKFCK